MIVWALIDDRIGSNNQSIAIAERLSRYYVIKRITYNSLIRLPNFVRGSSLLGVDKDKSDNIDTDLPDVIVSAGRRLSSVALNIKKRNDNRTFIINILDPNLPFNKFDLVLLPRHDDTPSRVLERGNVFETNGNINRVNSLKIKEESNKWYSFFNNYNKPLISLVIGGDTKNYNFNPKDFGEMVSNLSNITNRIEGTLLITTSRRTSNECMAQIRQKIDCDYYLYDWKWESDSKNVLRNNLGNPYYAFLGLSDFLVVTGDSMSMISEACSTGKPTYVYMPKNSLGRKHLRFCQEMLKDNYIREFKKSTMDLKQYKYTPLNELDRVVEFIYEKIKRSS